MTSKSVKGFRSCSSSRSHCPLRGASSPRSSPKGVRLGTPRPLRLHQPPQGGAMSSQTPTWVGPCLLKHAPVGGPVPSDTPQGGALSPQTSPQGGAMSLQTSPPGGAMSPQIPSGAIMSPKTPPRVGQCPFRHPPRVGPCPLRSLGPSLPAPQSCSLTKLGSMSSFTSSLLAPGHLVLQD